MAINIDGRRLNFERDVPDVLRLFERLFMKQTSRELWQWKYLPPWTDQPYAWVAIADGRIVGHIGAVPLRGQVHGEEVPFFLFGDSMIDAAFRTLAAYKQLSVMDGVEEIRREHPSAVLYGFGGKQVLLWTTWLSSREAAQSVERADDRIVRLPREAQTGGDAARFDIRPWSWDAAEIDDLWLQLKSTIRVGLIRDRAYLSWRYADHPVFEYSLFGVYEEQAPIGWLVTSQRDRSDEWSAEVRIQDMLLPPDVALPVLQRATSVLKAKSLVLWLPPHLASAGMESRVTGWHATYRFLSPAVNSDDLTRSIYYTLGEADEWWW